MKKVKIPINPKKHISQEIEVILGDEIENDFEVTDEKLPVGLPSHIDWVSNFKLIKKPGLEKKGVLVDYHIELDDRGKNLVFWDGRQPQSLKKAQVGGGRVRATLKVEDPPLGWEN
jgi:hypothetical protein